MKGLSMNASTVTVGDMEKTRIGQQLSSTAMLALLIPVSATIMASKLVRLIPAMVHWGVIISPVALLAAAFAFLPTVFAGVVGGTAIALLLHYCMQLLRVGDVSREVKAAQPRKRKVAVLGAGPAGLVAVKELVAEGHNVECFEASPDVGGVYAKCYDSARLTSSPFVTAFSDFAPSMDRHYHWKATEYVDYLSAYAAKFSLRQHISFNSWIVKVWKQEDGTWSVRVRGADGQETERNGFQHIAVCTGPNGHPNRPQFEGMESFPGEVVHSSEYKNAKGYAGKKVLVVGLGETAADVAAEVAAASPGALLSVRQKGAFVIPRINGLTGINNDYDSNRLRYSTPKALHNFTAWVCAGLSNLCGVLSPSAAMRFRLLSESGKAAFSQFATKSDEFVPALVNGSLAMKPGVKRFDGSTVTFTDGTTAEVDVVLFATGFGVPVTKMFNYFEPGSLKFSCLSTLYKYAFPTQHGDELAFFGFARPHIGSIPMMAELQSRVFAKMVSGADVLPPREEMEAEVAAAKTRWAADFGESRLRTMVNWIQYCDSLAQLIGCRPAPGLMATDPALAVKLVAGPFTSFHYRLSGPGAQPEASRETVMGLPNGMRGKDMVWFVAVHLISSVLRLGGLRSHIGEHSCSVY